MPIGQFWRDCHPRYLSDIHPADSFIEAFNDLACANLELEGLPSISRTVELLPCWKAANVVNADHVPWLNIRSLSLLDSLDLHR
jgi:hypothetical protein